LHFLALPHSKTYREIYDFRRNRVETNIFGAGTWYVPPHSQDAAGCRNGIEGIATLQLLPRLLPPLLRTFVKQHLPLIVAKVLCLLLPRMQAWQAVWR
jgi:hypothetical protein